MLVIRPRAVEDPAFRLFMFHHAGGSNLLYRGWAVEFPPDWEICLLEAPGRGNLQAQPLVDNCVELVALFQHAVLPLCDRPFAFFGHSMGGLLAYELTRSLLAHGEAVPRWLGVSAFGAPRPMQLPAGQHLLPEQQLKDLLRQVGGNAERLFENESLWQAFHPIFRNDFKVVDTWNLSAPPDPLPVPVTAFGGLHDAIIEQSRLAEWADHTEVFLGLNLYEGDHFYLRDHRRSIANYITDVGSGELCRTTRRVPGSAIRTASPISTIRSSI